MERTHPPVRPATHADVIAGLDAVLREALARPPCGVMFSGGRDSSVLLAAATRLAHDEGFEPPVAITLRFPGNADADEAAWQQHVIDTVKPADWTVIEPGDDFDLLGAPARAALRAHGVRWPPMAHNAIGVLGHVRGGSLIDGEGGDEVLGAQRSAPLARLVSLRRPPGLRLTAEIARAVAPKVVRRRNGDALLAAMDASWLTHGARAELRNALVADDVGCPLSWQGAVRWMTDRRAAVTAMTTIDAVGAEHDVVRHHPFFDDRFVTPFLGFGGRFGFHARTAALKALFTGLLPDTALRRVGKASFNTAAFGRESCAFAERWDGTGVDTALVDVDALRACWQRDVVPGGTFMLVQAAWLAS